MNETNPEWQAMNAAYFTLVAALNANAAIDLDRLVGALRRAVELMRAEGHVPASAWLSVTAEDVAKLMHPPSA